MVENFKLIDDFCIWDTKGKTDYDHLSDDSIIGEISSLNTDEKIITLKTKDNKKLELCLDNKIADILWNHLTTRNFESILIDNIV
jgi:hypothetical protein